MKTLSEALTKLEEQQFRLPQFFAEQGIKGIPDNATCCPVARYLCRETGGVAALVIGGAACLWLADGATAGTKLPASVAEFVTDFDSNKYPELVAS